MVSKLYATGSIVTDPDLYPQELELVVEFNSSTGDSYFHYFYALSNQLEELLNKRITLTDLNQLKNPAIKSRILNHSELLVG